MIVISTLLIGFVSITAFAQKQEPTTLVATLEVEPNFEFGQTNKQFRVHYPGVDEKTANDNPVSVKIYNTKNENSPPIHSYDIPTPEVSEKQAYYFAVEEAEAGDYAVEVCTNGAGSTCSIKYPSLTKMLAKDSKKITCNMVKKDSAGKWQHDSDFEINVVATDKILNSGDIEQIENRINQGKPGSYQTEFSKLGLQNNPNYDSESKTLYIGVSYDAWKYKQLFEQESAIQDKTRGSYTDEYCARKYILTANAHLLNPTTKKVEHRFKTTLHLTENIKKNYILIDNQTPIHIEMKHSNVEIKSGNYQVWISFCATEKDRVESTICADPYVLREFSV